jgi:hypothetical protein
VSRAHRRLTRELFDRRGMMPVGALMHGEAEAGLLHAPFTGATMRGSW